MRNNITNYDFEFQRHPLLKSRDVFPNLHLILSTEILFFCLIHNTKNTTKIISIYFKLKILYIFLVKML